MYKANVLITDDGTACLADFGLALAVESQVLSTTSRGSRGTLRWLAPEFIESSRKEERKSGGTKRDVYAFACTVLEVFFIYLATNACLDGMFHRFIRDVLRSRS
jgi:serine/threonine protein kinase